MHSGRAVDAARPNLLYFWGTETTIASAQCVPVRLNAVRSRPETDGIVGESNLAKTGGTQARAVHGTIASNADQRSKTNAQARAACSPLVYLD
jgi:hypothetical protein